jgi:hypothetical protein
MVFAEPPLEDNAKRSSLGLLLSNPGTGPDLAVLPARPRTTPSLPGLKSIT